MSKRPTNKKKKDYKVKGGLDYKRISTLFVDSIFEKANQNITAKDPLNSNIKEYYPNLKKKKEIKIPIKSDASHLKNKEVPNENEKKIPKTNYKHTSAEKINTFKYNNKYNFQNNPQNLIYNSSVKSIERKNNDINKNNKKINKRNVNKGLNTHSSINRNFMAKMESEKEKKYYQEKLRLLENRISALKNHNEELHRKIANDDVRQAYLEKKIKEKNDMRQALISNDINKKNELDLLKKQIKGTKDNLKKSMKESVEKSKICKMKDYQDLQKQKELAKSKITENKRLYRNYGRSNINRIKLEREEAKKNELKKQRNHGKTIDHFYLETCEDNKRKTINLKNKIKKLEKLEMKYMNNLNKTRKGFYRNNSEHYLYKKEMIPVEKLDFEKELDNRPLSRTLYKMNNKYTKSMDNLNRYCNVQEDENFSDNEIENTIKINKRK
jgi:hypothetical protein